MRREMWTPEIGAWGQGRLALHFALVAHVAGQVTADQLRDALRRLGRRHPLLTARVAADLDLTYWFESDETTAIEPLVLPRTDETTWLAAAAQTVGPLFDWERGPLARVTLVESPERCEIILAMHHCAGDGLSGAYAVHDLLTLLGDPALDLPPLNMPRCPTDLLPRWIRLLGGLVPLTWVFPGLGRAGDSPPPPELLTKHGAFHILTWALPPDPTQTLVRRSRAEGATVHSALATAVLRGWAAVVGGDSHTVSNPVSLRGYFAEPVGMALGNMIWPYNKVTLPNEPTVPFWDQARQFRADLKRQVSAFRLTFPLAVGQRAMNRYPLDQVAAAFGLAEESSNHTLSISNLGPLALAADYGPLRLTGVVGPLLDANDKEVVLGVATVNGTLTFAMTFREPILAPDTAARIRDAALAQLAAAVI